MTPETARYFALIVAAQARIAGMTAANMQRQAIGESMAYREDEFFYEANGLERLAIEVVQQ